jgi:hypothetical protein
MVLPQRTIELEFLLITAIQDREVEVSAAALHAAIHLGRNGALNAHIGLLVVVAERSFSSPHPLVRQLITRLATVLRDHTEIKSQQIILSEILSKAKADPHYMVRSATQ